MPNLKTKRVEKIWEWIKNNPHKIVEIIYTIIGAILLYWGFRMLVVFFNLFNRIPDLIRDLKTPHNFYALVILLYIFALLVGQAFKYGNKFITDPEKWSEKKK